MVDPDVPVEIVAGATAKRRLLIYTLLRLAGLVVLAAGVLRVGNRVDAPGVVMTLVGLASLFIWPRLLARLIGPRW